MGWTTPTPRATGYKVTAANWNELIDDLRYLKGLDGTATIQDGLITQELIPDANNTHDLGSNASRYRDIYLGGEAFLGDAGYITGAAASGTSGTTHVTRNAYYDAGTWKRRVADNDASALALTADGALVFYTNSDGNNTADSAITFAERFKINVSGIVTPKTTAFAARVPVSGLSNVTGDSTAYTVIFDTEDIDTSSAFNNATGIFTAPTTGLYNFSTALNLEGLPTDVVGYVKIQLVTTSRTYTLLDIPLDQTAVVIPTGSYSGALAVYLSSGDTAKIVLTIDTDASTKVVDIAQYSTFSGYLVSGA